MLFPSPREALEAVQCVLKPGARFAALVFTTPANGDLEVCALDYDGIVHALVFPCRKDGAQWVDALNRKRFDIQPTYWRRWTESH
jgi:hypothetical protein